MTAGCGLGEPLLGGETAGSFDGAVWTARFGIVVDRAPPDDQYGKLEIQLSEAPVDCSRRLGADHSAGAGIYAQLYLTEPVTGSFTQQWAQVSRVAAKHHLIFAELSKISNRASVTLTALTEAQAEGIVHYDDQSTDGPATTLEGSFVVRRCPPGS